MRLGATRGRGTRRISLAAAIVLAAIAAAVGVAIGPAASSATTSAGDGTMPALDHVFVIMLENHSKSSVLGDPNAPFINQLASTYAVAGNYYGVTHPSEPNYVAAISGSNWWTNTDDPANRFDHRNLVDELEAHHKTWDAYMEAMPSAGYLGDQWPSNTALYASKHDPFVLFDDIRDDPARLAHVKPYTDLATDLNSGNPPDFVWISPDQCNDMHGGVYVSVPGHPETPCPYGNTKDDANDAALKQKADAFVKQAVTTIMSSRAWTGNSAIFITTDEDDFTGNSATDGWESADGCCDSPVVPANDPDVPGWQGGVYGGGLVPAVIVTTHGKRGGYTSDTPYNHYSLLRTIEDAWGLGRLGFTSDTAQVQPMSEFFTH
jgi:hypothetical protein